MQTAERIVKESIAPKCWNCQHLTFQKQTRCFHCPVKRMSFPRNLIPYFTCTGHEICNLKGLAKRKAAGWNTVATIEELQRRYTPRESYLARRKDVGQALANCQTLRYNVH